MRLGLPAVVPPWLGRTVKSFTASTRLGPVKVRFREDGQPYVMKDGRTLAASIPTAVVVDGKPALSFPTDSEPLVCTPAGEVEVRQANSVTSGEGLALLAIDTPLTRWPGVFAVDNLPVVWGARIGPREQSVKGFTFDNGEQVEVSWLLDLVPVKRKCCGRR